MALKNALEHGTEDPARSDTSTGLGLTIAWELARRMSGKLEASLDYIIFCDKNYPCFRKLFEILTKFYLVI